jgi:hypothetical protein
MNRTDAPGVVYVEYNGHRLGGYYTTSTGMVHVTSIYGRKSMQLTDLPPERLARTLLLEIVRETDAIGVLKDGIGRRR